MSKKKTVRSMLAKYTDLLNKYGIDSDKAKQFIDRHSDNNRLVELAELSKMLKKTLTAPVFNTMSCPDGAV